MIVFMDLDDTLIDTQSSYEKAKQWLAETFGDEFVEQVLMIHLERAKAHLQFGQCRFTESILLAHTLMFGYTADIERTIVDTINDLLYSTFTLLADTQKALDKMLEMDALFVLYTLGDEGIQTKKIDSLNLSPYFDTIYITPRKTTDELLLTLSDFNWRNEKTYYIGDSMRSDIIPATEAGIETFWVNNNGGWKFDEAKIDSPFFTEVSTAYEALELICAK